MKKAKDIPLKNGDVIVNFDPLYLRNCLFLDYGFQGDFDQHWIAVPTVYRLTWFGGEHCAAEKWLTSARTWLDKVSLLKNRFLWHSNDVSEVSRFYHKLKYPCGKSPHLNIGMRRLSEHKSLQWFSFFAKNQQYLDYFLKLRTTMNSSKQYRLKHIEAP